MPCHYGSIKQIQQQLVANDCYVSEHALRSWVKDGTLPAVYSGRKAFISYQNVLEILNNGAVTPKHTDVSH